MQAYAFKRVMMYDSMKLSKESGAIKIVGTLTSRDLFTTPLLARSYTN